jgi:predicted outer membrane repeat protein
MKSIISTVFSMALLCSISVQAQVFVNLNSTGNAYTDLEVAINTSQEGNQIWVATGTYKPGGDMPTIGSYYQFPHNLKMYGGFAGTETMLTERNIEANVTVLSGDHNGDDVNDNFADFRTDNSQHVIWLTDTITNVSTIDGFTVRNGNTADADGSGNDRRGGGILTYGAPTIRNCTFTQNVGYFGGALYPRNSTSDGILIENCDFITNQTTNDGAAMYITSPSLTITECSFNNNTSGDLGGAIYNSADDGMTLTDCTFTSNQSQSGRGGAVYNSASPSLISDCTFMSNTALGSSGGAIQVRHTDEDLPADPVTITNCTFTSSNATFGGAIGCYDDRSVVNISNCDFLENNAANVGGAITNAFGANTNIEDCNFRNNQSGGSGGAVFSQNDSSKVVITNTLFQTNIAERGGAISMSGDDEPLSTTPLAELILNNCQMQFNSASEQGGAINLSNTHLEVVNSVFDFNFIVSLEGIGGAISLNTSDSISTIFNILNSTFASNSAFIGAGISNWKPDSAATSFLTIQNTIFDNPGSNNYEIEAGEPTVISNGGNLSSDLSMETILTNTNDLNEADPMFVDIDDFDYHLQDDSPAVNSGNPDGAPITDIEGNPRVDEVDMGAYENQNSVGVFEEKTALGNLSIFPNPVSDASKISLDSDWNGLMEIQIINANGKVIYSRQTQKFAENLVEAFPSIELTSGIYYLKISNDKAVSTVSFMK